MQMLHREIQYHVSMTCPPHLCVKTAFLVAVAAFFNKSLAKEKEMLCHNFGYYMESFNQISESANPLITDYLSASINLLGKMNFIKLTKAATKME
jgi:hypothetical protein